MVQRLPDAEVRFFWDDRRKRWAVTVWTQASGVATGTARSTAPIDAQTKHLMLRTVIAELESWLH